MMNSEIPDQIMIEDKSFFHDSPAIEKIYMKSREIYKTINWQWLHSNDIISFSSYPITTEYHLVK